MFREMMGFLKGLGIGAAICIALITFSMYRMKHNRRFRHKANKAMRSMNHMVCNMGHMFRFYD